MDEMEKRYAGSFFNNLPTRDNRTCVTQAQAFDGFSKGNDLLDLNEAEDEDLLQNFDGIPKVSIIDKMDQLRDSIIPPLSTNGRSSMVRRTLRTSTKS